MKELSDLRHRIDEIDTEIFKLFSERMQCSADVAEYKRNTGKPVYDAARERANIERASSLVQPEVASYAAVLESVLMEASRSAQYHRLGRESDTATAIDAALFSAPPVFPAQAFVACQGVEGAYSQIATDRLFQRANIAYFETWEGVFDAVERGVCRFGVLPIENSTAGSVNRVYDLMMQHDFHIVRTCRLKIDHNLLVKPGTKPENVHIVYSHQQAINQCANYLARFQNLRVHVVENTAVAAQMVAQSDRNDVAALASAEAAQLYGLEVAERNVQDQQNNYTRFACIAKDLTIYPGADRSTLMVVSKHQPGSLYHILARISALGINLLKLESRPIPEREFDFMFYFDVQCQAAAPEFKSLINSLTDVCEEFRYLGSYSEVV